MPTLKLSMRCNASRSRYRPCSGHERIDTTVRAPCTHKDRARLAEKQDRGGNGRSDGSSKFCEESTAIGGKGREILQRGYKWPCLVRHQNEERYLDNILCLTQPYHPVLITNCYLPPSTGTSAPLDPNTSSVHVFPANIYVSSIPNTPAAHESFVQRFLSSKTTFATKTELKYQEFEFTKEESSDDTGFPVAESDPSEYLGSMNVHLHYQKSNAPVILICGHKDRDIRCGTLGPILQKEFNRQIRSCIRTAVPKQTRMYSLDYRTAAALSDSPLKHTKVVLTSCVNGHAYAGNVVIYFPPKWIPKNGDDSVGGKGVWYGRVKPDHLSGIIQETLLNGRVIEELLRGVHRPRKWEPREEVVAGA